MKTICLYFEIHQIIHLKRYRFFDIGTDHYYYDDYENERSITDIAERSYMPALNTLQQMIAEKQLENATIYKRAGIDKKFFSKIISTKNYVPKKQTVMALGLALELPLTEYERFLASAGYAFMPSSKFDLIIKFCVLHQIYNLMTVDVILNDHDEVCFAQR